MIQSGDIAGSLRLFSYGLIVLIVVTFLVSLFAPYAYGRAAGLPLTYFAGTAVAFTVVVAVLAVILYFAYRYWLERSATKS